MMKTHTMRPFLLAAATSLSVLISPVAGSAQGLFTPVAKVDDQVVTRFEVNQRTLLMRVLNIPGGSAELAKQQLIEDRLKMSAAEDLGLTLTDEDYANGLEEFAARGNLSVAQFETMLGQAGVDPTTLRSFMLPSLTWRTLINARFARQVSVNEDDIDRAIDALTGTGSIRVLLSEVIIPLQQGFEEDIQDLAIQVAQTTSPRDFAESARRFSASNSNKNGGRLDWLPITQLPPALRPILLGLAPGETTDPIPFQGAMAIFQMRDVAESVGPEPTYEAVEYMSYYIPGGNTQAAQAAAQKIRETADTCDDLFGLNKDRPAELLEHHTVTPSDLPADIALELAKLDKGEVSSALTRNNGTQLMVLMLCGRSPKIDVDTSREDVAAQLRNRQLESLASAYLEELRSEARIVEK